MTRLGSYPSDRYSRSWITQRLVNRAPEWAQIRKSPTSVGQQLLNPIGLELQDTIQQLTSERFNMTVSTANISLLDTLYRMDLAPGMEFSYDTDNLGDKIYIPPTVYATINSTEYEITQAENNDIKTLAYDCLPSRVEDGETTHVYDMVVPRTQVSDLSALSPNSIAINGHLFITVRSNSNWEVKANNQIYYPKVYITGVTRKNTEAVEAVPIAYNGTFKTINEWQEVTSVFVSYLDDTAYLTIETFPFDAEDILDLRNIAVPVTGGERLQFIKLNSRDFGSSLVTQSYTLSNMDIVRGGGIDEKEVIYEIELLDEAGENITANHFVGRPDTKFIYVIDNDNFYVYNSELAWPELTNMSGESPETKMDLYSDRWVYYRGDTGTIKTRNLISVDPPWKNRWTLLDPDGNEYYMGIDGSLWPTTEDAWISNQRWEYGDWYEQTIDIDLTKVGEYVITLECSYINVNTNDVTVLITKFLFYVPAIRPEIQFALPAALVNSDYIGIDSDNNIWMHRYGSISSVDLFHDYFLVDYEYNKVWLKEDYTLVRIVL
jgi:hypothetical protein